MVLDKWYLDASLADGTVWYGYQARLWLWRHGSIPWTSGCESGVNGVEHKRSRWANWAEPEDKNGSWHWRGPDGFRGRWAPLGAGAQSFLGSDENFKVHWACVAPRAAVTRFRNCAAGNRSVRPEVCHGSGYIERLRLQTGRAALPFRDLWWGRAHAGDSSLVWIRWGRGRELTYLLENGAEVEGKIEPLSGGAMRIRTALGEWQTGEARVLCDRDVARSFPRWLVWLAGRIVPRRELKLAGPAQLRTAAGEWSGQAIWEEVTWQ